MSVYGSRMDDFGSCYILIFYRDTEVDKVKSEVLKQLSLPLLSKGYGVSRSWKILSSLHEAPHQDR